MVGFRKSGHIYPHLSPLKVVLITELPAMKFDKGSDYFTCTTYSFHSNDAFENHCYVLHLVLSYTYMHARARIHTHHIHEIPCTLNNLI